MICYIHILLFLSLVILPFSDSLLLKVPADILFCVHGSVSWCFILFLFNTLGSSVFQDCSYPKSLRVRNELSLWPHPHIQGCAVVTAKFVPLLSATAHILAYGIGVGQIVSGRSRGGWGQQSYLWS